MTTRVRNRRYVLLSFFMNKLLCWNFFYFKREPLCLNKRWGDLQIITNDDGTTKKRLFAAGSEGENNNVIYWDYDSDTDTFDVDATILDVSSIERSVDNELHVVSIRALPGALMIAGRDGAYFMKYNATDDTYKLKDVPGIEEMMNVEGTEYSDFWCFNSGLNDGTMVFITLRKPDGGKRCRTRGA